MSEYRVGLVLSGGGARGFAHVGVLQVIEELSLPIDLVVGVSMGSVIGASYAAGLSADQIAELVRAVRFSEVFRPRRGPLSLVDPRGMRVNLRRIFGNRRIEDLNRELVVVVSSMTTGLPLALRDGPLVDALLASCSIPLLYPPVQRDDHHLLDGGLIDGLPVALARELGARTIIAVDASSHARRMFGLPLVRHATRGVVEMLERRSPPDELDAFRIVSRVLRHSADRPPLPPVELLIRPRFGLRSTFHYRDWQEMIRRGRKAADAVRPTLEAIASVA